MVTVAMVPGAALWGGFAAPPQLDLYARTPYYLGTGTFEFVPFGRLDTPVDNSSAPSRRSVSMRYGGRDPSDGVRCASVAT